MADINTSGNVGRKRGRSRRSLAKIDFTPMVDLGFLLISFFMLTTTLRQLRVIPVDAPALAEPTPVTANTSLTVLIDGKGNYYYYSGDKPDHLDTLHQVAALGKLLQRRNARMMDSVAHYTTMAQSGLVSKDWLQSKVQQLGHQQWALNALIKATDRSHYQDLVDVLDQVHKAHVVKMAIMDMTDEERLAVKL
jgi:biopolymer transport protein ExbD